ncbi:N-acetyltransferase domain-containing protein [Chromobacterium violaceum]|uniref:hypothetical protein n=1 Tax=Chromobacterium violaceum TaxID=536 RepID=UPI003CECC64E
MEVSTAPYHQLPQALRREINVMLHLAYQCEGEADLDETLHRAELDAQSFCLLDGDGRVAAYAAVLGKSIAQQGQAYALGSLSCVATHPAMRGRGLGARGQGRVGLAKGLRPLRYRRLFLRCRLAAILPGGGGVGGGRCRAAFQWR